MKSVLSFFLFNLMIGLNFTAFADTKVSATNCQYVASVPGSDPVLHEVHCGKLKGFVTGDSKLTKLKIDIKRVKAGKELSTSSHEEVNPPGTLNEFLQDSIETNKFLNEKYKLGFEDVVSVAPAGISLPNDSTIIYALKDGKYEALGTIDAINQNKQKEKEKALQSMEGTHCFQEKDDVTQILSYEESCKGEDGKVKPVCYMDIHCIKREKVSEKILSYHRTQAACGQVDGACPSANDCARDLDVSALKKLAPVKAVQAEEAPEDGAVAK